MLLFALAALVSACGVLPDRPASALLYDFGPEPAALAAPAVAAAAQAPLLLAEVDASPRLEGSQLLYRLGYADANELRAYGQARWSTPPPQLLHQRLRQVLAAQRPVLSIQEAAGTAGRAPEQLRLTLDEFSHYFESPTRSQGWVRLRATLWRPAAAVGGQFLQRSFSVRREAPSADAAGGVKALAAASEQVVGEIAAWVQNPGPVGAALFKAAP